MKMSDLEVGDIVKEISTELINGEECKILYASLWGDKLVRITFELKNGNMIFMVFRKDKEVSNYFEIVSLKE